MTTFIALFRGINVGGNNSLPMKQLAVLLERLGLADVRTYIQSGNVVFRSSGRSAEDLRDDIAEEVEASCGFRPEVLVVPRSEFQAIAEANPYQGGDEDAKSVHIFFLKTLPPNPSLDRLEYKKADSERFVLAGKAFYLHAPDGIGRSKLAAAIEAAMGVPTTGRNWRTVSKLLEMAKGSE